MEGYYEIQLEGEPCGKVEAVRKGLYCTFTARCRLPQGKICRLIARWQDHWENLGIPVPEGEGFLLEKKLPRKKLGQGEVDFVLVEKGEDIQARLYPAVQEPEPEAPAEELPSEEGPGAEDSAPEEMPEPVEEVQEAPRGSGEFLPLEPDKPFDSIEALEEAVFAVVNGQPGLMLEDQSARESPTGQWSEPSTEA